MPVMNAATLQRLEALHALNEESMLGVIETEVASQLIRRLIRVVAQPPKRPPDDERLRLVAEVRRELAEQSRILDQVLLTELANWRFFAGALQSALEEEELWRPPIRPFGSRQLYPSGTRTTTGTSST